MGKVIAVGNPKDHHAIKCGRKRPYIMDSEQNDEEGNGDPIEQVDIHALDEDKGEAEEAGAPEEEELEPQPSSSSV